MKTARNLSEGDIAKNLFIFAIPLILSWAVDAVICIVIYVSSYRTERQLERIIIK